MLEFWYEFASTYSYLSAQRIESAARAACSALPASWWATSSFWGDDRLEDALALASRPK